MIEGMSAAKAADDNRDAAPAATIYFTLRIGFVLLSGEADNEASHPKTHTDDAIKSLSAA